MKTELIRIGNSRGIRIPKPFIEELGLGEKVDLRVENGHIVISPQRNLREGWEERFVAAAAGDQDELLLQAQNEFDREEWEW
jgi:antitoxin MazE